MSCVMPRPDGHLSWVWGQLASLSPAHWWVNATSGGILTSWVPTDGHWGSLTLQSAGGVFVVFFEIKL